MLSHFGRALRTLAVTAVLCAAIAPASAHEGHDHGEQPPVSAGALPRGEADSDAFEIVAIVRGENLEIYLDRFATNEPVTGATLEVESPSGPVRAAEGADGTYRVTAPWLAKNGRADLIFTVTAGDTTDILPLTVLTALAEATQHRGFWLLTASFFVCGFQTIFVMTHLPAYLVDQGLSANQGMAALAVLGLFNIVGSLGAGALGGRYSKRLVLAWFYVTRAVAITIFLAAPLTPAGTYLFAAVLGLTWLGTVPLTNSLVGQIFGVKYLSTLFSIAFLGHQLGAFIEYKARRAGVLVVWVDPAYTSQTCSACGHVDRKSRINQATFECCRCGFAGHADVNAAVNLSVRGWAVVNQPHADARLAASEVA